LSFPPLCHLCWPPSPPVALGASSYLFTRLAEPFRRPGGVYVTVPITPLRRIPPVCYSNVVPDPMLEAVIMGARIARFVLFACSSCFPYEGLKYPRVSIAVLVALVLSSWLRSTVPNSVSSGAVDFIFLGAWTACPPSVLRGMGMECYILPARERGCGMVWYLDVTCIFPFSFFFPRCRVFSSPGRFVWFPSSHFAVCWGRPSPPLAVFMPCCDGALFACRLSAP